MAMNATKVALNVMGVNRTGKVFREIAASAASVGRAAALAIGGGIASAAGSFALTASSLGHLSDVAMQAGTSAEEITKLSTALNVLGVKSQSPEQVALAFQRMGKAIGETGLAGFRRSVEAISQLTTLEERSAAAMAVFGNSGLDFMPLIEAAAQNGAAALDNVIAGMPAISQAAADAGDAVADAMVIMTKGSKSLWSEAIGAICAAIDGQFTGGVRAAAMRGNAYMEYFAKVGVRHVESFAKGCVSIWNGLGGTWGAVVQSWGDYLLSYFKALGGWLKDVITVSWDDIRKDGFFGKANANFGKAMSAAADELWQGVDFSPFVSTVTEDLDRELTVKIGNAAKAAASVGAAAVGAAADESSGEASEKIKKAARDARNELLQGGGYKAATMAIRADYARGEDRTTNAVNAAKNVLEKINSASQKMSAALEGGFAAI